MMKITALMIVMTTALIAAQKIDAEVQKKSKRGISPLEMPGFDVLGVLPTFSTPWNIYGNPWPVSTASDLALSQVQSLATHNIALQVLKDPVSGTTGIAYSPEVLRAIQQAKEANHNVLRAQQRVSEAKQAALIQQKIALAKEASARETVERSEAISAQAQAEARAGAQQLVALQQRLATLKDAVAAAQRVAAAREAAAAAAIQRTASATAAELRKQEVDKQINQSEQEAKLRDVVAAKENAIANALNQASAHKSSYQPWG